ncbi:MAG TPA: DNA polymerase ligase N-terminal domain-containing protein, partial [Acidiferrobacteraceae bacterium]|nr:DNA polymerase ligase N-terminal domain-containing protein [Acidiferrobacteraceae bacterium]
MDRLDRYRKKRRFSETPEPAGTSVLPPAAAGAGPRFVIQEHHASHLHWDFRLEHEGVLASWAVPKGVPMQRGELRLAVQTEDHPLAYAQFAGEIPPGHYGAGTVEIWDTGTYECHKFEEREVSVTLHGARVRGRYVLVHRAGSKWLMRRLDSALAPLPAMAPMLATLGSLPPDPQNYAFEIKWDGYRALVAVADGQVRIASRNGRDLTSAYPELLSLGRAMGRREALLDGELVVLDPDGRSDFSRLQQRGRSRASRGHTPVTYMIFDLLRLDGRDLRAEPYEQRHEALMRLALQGPNWQTPANHRGSGRDLLQAAAAAGLEGIVAKRRDSPYRSDVRSRDWIKIKLHGRQEFVLGGWTQGSDGRLRALLLGYFTGGTLH